MEQIPVLIAAVMPSIMAILSIIVAVVKMLKKFNELKEDVKQAKEYDELKKQFKLIVDENYKLKKVMHTLVCKIDKLRVQDDGNNEEI